MGGEGQTKGASQAEPVTASTAAPKPVPAPKVKVHKETKVAIKMAPKTKVAWQPSWKKR